MTRQRFVPIGSTAAILAALAILLTFSTAPANSERSDAAGQARWISRSPELTLEVLPEQRLVAVNAASTPGTLHLQIRITADDLPRSTDRLPTNVCLVLDKSGSMNGDNKWGYVHRAVGDVFDRMGDKDYLSLVTYDSSAQVLIEPIRHIDPDWARKQLSRVSPGGNTALYAGLELGAQQVREFANDNYVTRVILLSDGLANVGPSSPQELRRLAENLTSMGLAVSTIGVGTDYNEDLMLGVAKESGGNYYFINESQEIPAIFDEELSGVSSVVARDLEIIVELPDGVRFRRSLDKEGEIERRGNQVCLKVPALSANRTAGLVLELDLAEGFDAADVEKALASVSVQYRTTNESGDHRTLNQSVNVRTTRDLKKALATQDETVAATVLKFQMVENRERAMQAMDDGDEARASSYFASNEALFDQAPASLQAAPGVAGEMEATETDKEAYERKDEAARKQAQFSIYSARKK